MKQILFYTDTNQLGGTEEHMFLLAKFLPKNRFHITLACGKSSNLNSWCARFLDIGAQVIRLNTLHKHDPRHYLDLQKIIKKFDILHLHLWNPASCRWALKLAKKIPTIITEHDPFKISKLKTWIKRQLTNSTQQLIVCSKAAEKIMNENFSWLAKNITVIPNGIDIELWEEKLKNSNRDEIRREEFGVKQNEIVILCVAELAERKGQKYLIEAVEKLTRKNIQTKLVLAGSGAMQTYYESIAKKLKINITFLGQRTDIQNLMAAADIFVLPSEREAFGIVLLEAAIAQLPIVASNVGGIREIIYQDQNGILVEEKNSSALAEGILRIIENPEFGRKLGITAHKTVNEKFNANLMALETAKVYDLVLNQTK